MTIATQSDEGARIIKKLRESFPELPELLTRLTIRIDTDEVIEIDCSFIKIDVDKIIELDCSFYPQSQKDKRE